ncbi:peptide chain release factor 1, mitochondrial isoform X1 [Trichomycterus rosablanca]|uniref:peptide chain release factor 1, mitochondrial isoform X1 n=1 Tax=Trichomycterus rosablanca TaxID=2290929 RepID=UPI002F35EFCE
MKGGLHHASVKISGESVYSLLKFEGGTHKVQRIPEVGLSSRMQRIHTGTMTVIILPQPSNVDINIDPKDLRIDTFRSKGAGGQSVNTTDSAVRIVHIPTGTVAECQESRSQLQNRDTAMRVLRARMYQNSLSQQMEKRDTARKQQVGTRSQSERIRTYNFSQDRFLLLVRADEAVPRLLRHVHSQSTVLSPTLDECSSAEHRARRITHSTAPPPVSMQAPPTSQQRAQPPQS